MPSRTYLHRARVLAAGTALAAGGLMSLTSLATPSGASADPADDMTPLVNAPPCVKTSHREDLAHNYVDIRNTCASTYRVKAIINNGFDSPCVTLAPGRGYTHAYGEWGSLDHVEIC